jgi:hypothetical protein
MKVEFILRDYPDKPDELFIVEDGKERRASKADAKAHPAEYKALKMKLAQEPERLSFEARSKLSVEERIEREVQLRIGKRA